MNWDEFLAENIPDPRTITVEPYVGTSAYGPVYGAPVVVEGCVVEDTRRLVRVQTQDAAGTERVSSTTVYGPPSMVAPAGSRVTLPAGRRTTVMAASYMDAHGHDLPEHWELALE